MYLSKHNICEGMPAHPARLRGFRPSVTGWGEGALPWLLFGLVRQWLWYYYDITDTLMIACDYDIA